jgi:hypothetical protein
LPAGEDEIQSLLRVAVRKFLIALETFLIFSDGDEKGG